MADSSPLAGLLDRASHVFSLAQQLGASFERERGADEFRYHDRELHSWRRHRPACEEYCKAVLDLKDAIQNPPQSFAPVAQALLKAARVAKQIGAVMQTSEGRTWDSFLEFFPELNSVAAAGRQALREVSEASRQVDPFAFVDQPPAGTANGIDVTPTTPKPPPNLIESAARAIPNILANLKPCSDGQIGLVASHLAKQLQDCGHTLAAAQWAIHEAIQAGRLEAGRVEACPPTVISQVGRRGMFGLPDTRQMEWPRGGRSMIAIPQGKPAPFDSFKVVATQFLWDWWHLIDARERAATKSTAKGNSPTDNSEEKVENPPVSGAAPKETMPAQPIGTPSIALLRVFTNGMSDDRIKNATVLLTNETLTANEKLTKIDELIPFPPTASAEQLGELLDVTKQAVLKTEWWLRNRKGEKDNEIGRRAATHKNRAKN